MHLSPLQPHPPSQEPLAKATSHAPSAACQASGCPATRAPSPSLAPGHPPTKFIALFPVWVPVQPEPHLLPCSPASAPPNQVPCPQSVTHILGATSPAHQGRSGQVRSAHPVQLPKSHQLSSSLTKTFPCHQAQSQVPLAQASGCHIPRATSPGAADEGDARQGNFPCTSHQHSQVLSGFSLWVGIGSTSWSTTMALAIAHPQPSSLSFSLCDGH
jgi:hypothetical protein